MDKATVAFGHRLRVLRRARGLSQDALAVRAGLHRNYVGMLERGASGVTLETLAQLARAMGLSLPDLVDVKVEPAKPNPQEETLERLIRRLRGKPHRKLRLVEKLARVVLEEREP